VKVGILNPWNKSPRKLSPGESSGGARKRLKPDVLYRLEYFKNQSYLASNWVNCIIATPDLISQNEKSWG
jgi:hypothetical protein